jgi:hypothetical protein
MPQSEARAWWADVQHVRESIERRRADDARSPVGPDAGRFARAAEPTAPVIDDGDWSADGAPARPGRFDREPRLGDSHSAPGSEASSPPTARRPGGAHRDGERPVTRARQPRPESDRRRARSHRPGGDHADGAADRRRAEDSTMAPPPPGRRTVRITGRTVSAPSVPRLVEVQRRRPARHAGERVGARPDRIAMWAVLLGFFLILVAATSSPAATPAAPDRSAAVVATHAAGQPHAAGATVRLSAHRAPSAAPARITLR